MSQTPLFQYVKPKLFIAYLEQNGFQSVPRKNSSVKCFQKILGGELFQISVPMSSTLVDFEDAMQKAIETVAKVQKTSVLELCVRFSALVRTSGRIECSTIKGSSLAPIVQVVFLDKETKVRRTLVKVQEGDAKLIASACHDNLVVDIIGLRSMFREYEIEAIFVSII